MTIGELAEKTGVPETRIRYYEKVEVLPPADRTPNGYRAYGADAVTRLEFLQRAKLLGLRLAEVSELLRAADEGCCEAADPLLETLLRDRHAEVEHRIAELEALRRSLEEVLGRVAEPARGRRLVASLACAGSSCAEPETVTGRG